METNLIDTLSYRAIQDQLLQPILDACSPTRVKEVPTAKLLDIFGQNETMKAQTEAAQAKIKNLTGVLNKLRAVNPSAKKRPHSDQDYDASFKKPRGSLSRGCHDDDS